MYLVTQTRPDISFPVQWLARAFQASKLQHLSAAQNLFRYLNSHRQLAIRYSAKGLKNPLQSSILEPIGYSDSDYAGDKASSKSTYGYVFTLGRGPISWKLKRGSTIALSTLEAEFIGLIEATREIQWLRGLYTELNRPIPRPTILYGDNTGAISTAKDPSHHRRTKHTLLRYHYLRAEVQKGTLEVKYLETSKMVADGLTKALPAPKFQVFLGQLGLVELVE
jgi:hypothetical protein